LALSATLLPYTTLFRSLIAPQRVPSAFRLLFPASPGNSKEIPIHSNIAAPTILRNGVANKLSAKKTNTIRIPIAAKVPQNIPARSEEHTSELQSRFDIV